MFRRTFAAATATMMTTTTTQKTNYKLRPAIPSDAVKLTNLAIRSKAYWGYSAEFMQQCQDELKVTKEKIQNELSFHFVVAEKHQQEDDGQGGDDILGFYAIDKENDNNDSKKNNNNDDDDNQYYYYELEALFVDPKYMGMGVGSKLMNDAKTYTKSHGMKCLVIQSDPNAQKFYEKSGATFVNFSESDSIPGRLLPKLQINFL